MVFLYKICELNCWAFTKRYINKKPIQFLKEGKMVKKKILVVDDETDIRNLVKEILVKDGFSVTTAVNGDDGLEKFKKVKPDLVILDVMMPGTPVRKIIPKLNNTKVIFLTVLRTSEAEKQDILKMKNVRGFMQKPFDIDELSALVKKVLAE